MAEKVYIERDELESRIKKYVKCRDADRETLEWAKDECIRQAHCMPAADVVSKNESREINSTWAAIYAAAHEKWEKAYEQIEYTLIGVMHSVDKWLEGDELIDDEVNRAITMREKTLQMIENAKSEVAREIFAEIEALATKHLALLEILNPQMSAVAAGGKHAFDLVLALITELKKKYTEEDDGT